MTGRAEGSDDASTADGTGAARVDEEQRGESQRGERHVDDADRPDAHLRDLGDGCGCAEVWEHLSETRESDGDD